MKKLALSLILACLSVTAAFAQNVNEAGVSTSAAPAVNLPTVQDVADGANKLGNLVGGVFQGTFKVGAALFSGIKSGVTGSPAVQVESPAQPQASASASQPSDASQVKVVRTPAPVEDRSTYLVAEVD